MARFGRASGGMLLGYRKGNFKWSIKFVNMDERVYVWLRHGQDEIKILPVYINGARWNEEFGIIEEWCVENNSVNTMVIGDFNARIGELQTIDNYLYGPGIVLKDDRLSCDKVVNANGRRVIELVDDAGLVILNGRTINDKNGSFTFCGGMGDSVIDFACVSMEA